MKTSRYSFLLSLTLDPTLLATENDGLQELVVLALLVSRLDGGYWVAAFLTLTSNQALHADLDTVPPLIAVHDVVATDDGCDLAEPDLLGRLQQILHVTGAGLGVGVTAVTEEVDVDLGDAHLLRNLEQSDQVVDVGVDTAVRHQSAEVKPAVAVNGALERLLDILDVAELVALDSLPNADGVLPDNTAGT